MSEKKIAEMTSTGVILVDYETRLKQMEGRKIPEYPLVGLMANRYASNNFKENIQYFLLESLVRTQDSNIYVICSKRYEMNVDNSKHIMNHMEEFQ
jgi:hypothetical protein